MQAQRSKIYQALASDDTITTQGFENDSVVRNRGCDGRPHAVARKEAVNANIRRATTLGCADRRHIDLNDSKVVELYRCALSYRDGNPWAGADVASPASVVHRVKKQEGSKAHGISPNSIARAWRIAEADL